MKELHNLRNLIIPASAVLFAWSCAQQGAPQGGPRDEDPPVVLESEPPLGTTMFDSKKILITFDEYIVLDNVNQQLVVSPPMEEKPEVKLRKKTLIIEFREELKDSTTYTLNFGSSIKDLHEGNMLHNFEYVFSTGNEIDSLSVKGQILYAQDLKAPEEAVTVMLYEDLRDSVPLLDIPMFVGRSNDSGEFSVNNLKAGEYKVFALKDGNYNLLFDLPTEEIAFLDSSLILDAELNRSMMEADSGMVMADSLTGIHADSQRADSSLLGSTNFDSLGLDSLQTVLPDYNTVFIDLLLFTEESEIQYLTEYNRDDPRKLQMIFALPLTDSFSYQFLEGGIERQIPVLEDFSEKRDSLDLWLRDSMDFKKDTLWLQAKFTAKDTMDNYVSIADTLRFTYRKNTGRSRGKKQEEEEEKLEVTTVRKNQEHAHFKPLGVNLNFPLEYFNDSLIQLYHIPDSIEIPVDPEIWPDTLSPYGIKIGVQWEPTTSYRLLMLPGALGSIYELEHDTVDREFKIRDNEYYGTIILNLDSVNNPVIVQLLNKDNVYREIPLKEGGEHIIEHLNPQEYNIRIIHDLNDNGRWDTGKYMEGKQPEPVEDVPKTIEVRSNWEHNVRIVLVK